jgi:hypothetical protein
MLTAPKCAAVVVCLLLTLALRIEAIVMRTN